MADKLIKIIKTRNVTTRNAFYDISMYVTTEKQYYIQVQWGRINTKGQIKVIKRSKKEETIEFVFNKLVEQRKNKHYQLITDKIPIINKTSSSNSLQISVPKKQDPSLQRFLYLENE